MSTAQAEILAVLFDADGVIQWPTARFLERFEELGGPGFIEEAFAAETLSLTGKADLNPALQRILDDRGIERRVEDVHAIWYDIEVDPEALALVRDLRAAGVVCALATNQQSYRGGHMQATLGYQDAFDRTFYSFEVGLAKPDPAYFRAIVEELGIAPGQALFFDDKQENIDGARAAGLQALLHPWGSGATALREAIRARGVPGA